MHKKNAVVKENWLLIDDWYIHPEFHLLQESGMRRWTGIVLERPILGTLKDLPTYLAHKCKDGKIGRVYNGGVHKSKRTNLYKIYGKCFYCQSKVGEGVHTIINLIKSDMAL